MYIPDTYDPNVPSAVIWGLHGMFQGIDTAEFLGFYAPYIQGTECYQVAPYGNAIVIVPQGYNAPFRIPFFPENNYGWDSNNSYPDNEDVEFYRWFIEDYLVNNEVGDFGILNINRRRIYIGGYSMGGMINTCAGKIRDGQEFAAMYHIAGGKFFDEPINVSRKYPAYVVIGSDDTDSGDPTQALLNTYITGNHPYYYQVYPDVDHREAMLAGNIDPFHNKTFYKDCWDWLVQWALNDEAILLNGTAEESGDYHKFSVEWQDADNDDPTYKMVVNVDGIEYSMEKEDPSDLDNTDGCLYTCMVSSSVLGEGLHYYYFEGIEGDHYGPYNIIEAGQGPYDISTAKTNIANFSITEIIDKFPSADFLLDKFTASVGEEIHYTFTGSEGNPPTDFLWDFGDGYNSSERNPTHIYNTTGIFSVSLTIIDYDGDSDFTIQLDIINVTAVTEPEHIIPENPIIPGFPLVPLGISSLLCYFGLLLNKRKQKIQY